MSVRLTGISTPIGGVSWEYTENKDETDSLMIFPGQKILISQGKNQKERMELLRQLAVQQLQTLEAVSLNNLPQFRK